MAELIRKTFVYRAYPNRAQVEALEYQLAEAARLYNAALQERRDAWAMRRHRIGYFSQSAQLKDIRAAQDIGIANAWCAREVLRRVDRAFQAFFRRCKAGEAPGHPRFRSAARYDSLTFRWDRGFGDGCAIEPPNHVRFQGIGSVQFKLHRPIEGQIKIVTIRRTAGRWFIAFSVKTDAKPLPPSSETVGIDVGLASFATLSDGADIENPRHARAGQSQLRLAQRRLARRRKGSARRRRARLLLARAHARVRNQRKDFHHKVAHQIVQRFGTIAVENLNVKGLARTRLARSIHDAGWSAFISLLAVKAVEAGRELVKVDARGTSQTCLCGCEVRKGLKDRWHDCPECGLSLPRRSRFGHVDRPARKGPSRGKRLSRGVGVSSRVIGTSLARSSVLSESKAWQMGEKSA